ncbi:MAG: hypothetical protein SFT94_05870 [Pseudanabaenaceae cyanobacterium bins.68]|nr:hypothetical protein [Pseudanabaenaceae cyanobacterium bins.68]
MTIEDYMNPEKFPITTQEGLSVKDQFLIDAINYDQLVEAREMGKTLNTMQLQAEEELKIKIPAQEMLKLSN